MEKIIAGIDVGTTKVCALIGEATEHGSLRIIGMGEVASRGLNKGVIVNVQEATRAITEAVHQAEQLSGYTIARAWVGVGGAHIASTNSHGVVAVANGRRGISQEDIDRALRNAKVIAIPHNHDFLHVIPRSYIVDGQDGVHDPLGMQGYRLEVEAHIITGASNAVNNLVRCVQGAEVGVEGLVLQALASGEAILAEQGEMGVVLADIGGGTTDIGVFIGGAICHTQVLPVAGNHLTNDLAIGLRAPFATAEEVKRRYGQATVASVPEGEAIEVALFGETGRQPVPRALVAEILAARAEEILSLIMREIKRSGYDGLLPAGLVLCGGTANLPGLRELGRSVTSLPTRVEAPKGFEGLAEKISDPAYATSAGLLLWAMRQGKEPEPESQGLGIWGRISQWLRTFLPD